MTSVLKKPAAFFSDQFARLTGSQTATTGGDSEACAQQSELPDASGGGRCDDPEVLQDASLQADKRFRLRGKGPATRSDSSGSRTPPIKRDLGGAEKHDFV